MEEALSGDIGVQILQAVQGLAVRMDRLEARMDGLEARMSRLEVRMDRLEARMDRLEARMDKLEARVDELSSQVNALKSRMEKQELRMEKQEMWMERLGAEFINWREGLREEIRQLRTEMLEGFHRLTARLNLTDATVVLMASVLRRPTELGEELEGHLRELAAR